MQLTAAEKIKIILSRRKMTFAELAKQLGQSRQNLSNKINRNNFNEKELFEIAKALNCSYEARFIMNDTGDEI